MNAKLALTLIPWVAVIATSLWAMLYDLKQGRIPNILAGGSLLGGLIWSSCMGGAAGLAHALGAMALLAAPFIVLFLLAGGGAGDAKLMGALGAWVGVEAGLVLLTAVLLCGGVIGLGYALAQGRGRQLGRNLWQIAHGLPWIFLGPGSLRQRAAILPAPAQMVAMPYALAIFAGSCLAGLGVWLWPG